MRTLLRNVLALAFLAGTLLQPMTAAHSDTPSPASAEALAASAEALAASAEKELLGNILPFWQTHAPAFTGLFAFQGEVGPDLQPDQRADRGMLLYARILWTFSAAHRLYPEKGYLVMADRAWEDLEKHFWDARHGGYFWSLRADGGLSDPRKQVYGQSFALYGLAEYHLASGRPEPLARARELFALLEKHSHDALNGGYIEAYTADWKRPRGQAMSVIGPDFAKSQNTHLHLMEAFSNLLRAWPDPLLRTRLREVTELMITKVPTPDGRSLQLYFDADWTPRSNRFSPGHDIEANWLLCDAADTLAEPDLTTRVHRAALRLADATLERGMDRDGGIWNEAGPSGLTNAGKDWWAQAEAAVGFLNSYQLTRDKRHFEAASKVWDFALTRVVDRKSGDWHYGVDPAGRVVDGRAKISTWKCPYHTARACMELLRRARSLPPEGRPLTSP